MRLEINANDLRRYADQIAGIVLRGQDTRPMYEEIAEYGVISTERRFRSEIGPDGTPWKKSIRAQKQGDHTLKDSGRLAASISPEAHADMAAWGTSVPYAAPNQFGATIKPVTAARLLFNIPGIGFRSAQEITIPARPFIGFNAEDEDAIGEIIQDHYFRGMPH